MAPTGSLTPSAVARMVNQAEDDWKARASLLDVLEQSFAQIRPGAAARWLLDFCWDGRRKYWGVLREQFGHDAETGEWAEDRLLSDDELAQFWWEFRCYFLWTSLYEILWSRLDDGPEVVVQTFFVAIRRLHPMLVASSITSPWPQVAAEATCDAAGWVAAGQKLRNLPKRDRLSRELETGHGTGRRPLREQLPGVAYIARLEGGLFDPIDEFEQRVVRLLETGLRPDQQVFDAEPPEAQDQAPSPEDAVLADEAYAALLGQLAPHQAEIARLRANGFSVAEIAARLEVVPNTVWATLFQTRAKVNRLRRAAGE